MYFRLLCTPLANHYTKRVTLKRLEVLDSRVIYLLITFVSMYVVQNDKIDRILRFLKSRKVLQCADQKSSKLIMLTVLY